MRLRRSEDDPTKAGYDDLPREVKRRVAIIVGNEVRIARLVVGVTDSGVLRIDNLRKGVAALRKEPAHIVLVAQDADGHHAQDVLRLLRRHEATAAIPVVVAAYAPDPEERTELRTLGARRYLPPSVRPEHLLGLLDELSNRAADRLLDDALAPYAAPAGDVADVGVDGMVVEIEIDEPDTAVVDLAAGEQVIDDRVATSADGGSVVLPMSIDAILRTPIDLAQIPTVAMADHDQLLTDVVLMQSHVAASDRRAIEAEQEADELRRFVAVARADIARLEVTVDSLNDALTRTREDLEVAEELAGLR